MLEVPAVGEAALTEQECAYYYHMTSAERLHCVITSKVPP